MGHRLKAWKLKVFFDAPNPAQAPIPVEATHDASMGRFVYLPIQENHIFTTSGVRCVMGRLLWQTSRCKEMFKKTSTKTRQPCIVEDCVTFYKTNFQQFKPWSEIVICSSSFTLSSWNFHPSCPSILSMNLIWWLSHLWKNMLSKWKIISPSRGTKHIYRNLWETNTKVASWKRRPAPNSSSKKTCPKNQYLPTLVFSLQQKHIPWCKKQKKHVSQQLDASNFLGVKQWSMSNQPKKH